MFRLLFESLIGVYGLLVSAFTPAGDQNFHPCGPGLTGRPDLWRDPR